MTPSPVWCYFTKSKDRKQVKCKTCKVNLTYKNSTTNMILHIKKVHKIELPTLAPKVGKQKRTFYSESNTGGTHDEEDDADNPSPKQRKEQQMDAACSSSSSMHEGPLKRCIGNMNQFSVGGARDAQCTNALLHMIAADSMPLSTTERPGFRAFVRTLQPLYQVPSEPTVTKLLLEKYEMLRRRVGSMLSDAKHITLTLDLWTHKYTMRGYLGVTAHFKKDSDIVSFELSARLMDGRKTIANLRTALREVCADWQVPYNNIRAVVTDGGANVKAAAKEEFGAEKHLSCTAHQLNLIAQSSIDATSQPTVPSERQTPELEVPENESDAEEDGEREPAGESGYSDTLTNLRPLLKKLKKIVRFFKKSEVATAKLLDLQRNESGMTEDKLLKLIQEIITRWNSCFGMIDRYLTLAPYVNRVLYDVRRDRSSKMKPPEPITGEEEEILREVKDLLSPLHRATSELSSEKNVTLSKCISIIKNLKGSIAKLSPTTPIAFNLQKKIMAGIEARFGSIEDVKIYAAATLLDPRFKKVGFTSNERTPLRVANAITFVGTLVKAKMREALDAHQHVETEEEPQEEMPSDDYWDDFDKEVVQRTATTSGQDMAGGIPIQLRMFLDAPPVDRKSNPNPLLSWERLKGEYKYVHAVAEEFLSILATSVPCERLFSHAGLIASQLRTQLSEKHLEMLVFLRSVPESLWLS